MVEGGRPPLGHAPAGEPVHVFSAPKGTLPRPEIARAEGLYMWDGAGKRYLDACSGPVACNLGHGNARVLAALNAQAAAATFASLGHFESRANRAMSDLLAGLAGPGFERVFPTSGGSEAIEAAIKFARQYKVAVGEGTRWKVIGREPSYHGNTLGAFAAGGDAAAREIFGPLTKTMPKVPAPLSYRPPAGHDAVSYAEAAAAALDERIRAEGPETVLAFILEPVGGVATGALVAPASYYAAVRRICDDHGVVLVHDEVMSGCGRSGYFVTSDGWPGARPDLLVLAKGLAGGYLPLGALLAPAAWVERVAAIGGFAHGHTYTGHPLAAAVGEAVLTETRDRDLPARAARLGADLKARLTGLAARQPLIGDVRGQGLLLAVELVEDRDSKRAFAADRRVTERLGAIAQDLGLLIYGRRTNGGRYGEWVMIAPPLIAGDGEIDEIVSLFDQALSQLTDELAASR